MATKLKKIALATALIVIVGVAGVIVWHQFYQPNKVATGPINIIDDLGRNVTLTEYPPERSVLSAQLY